jgi:hypothetical protein
MERFCLDFQTLSISDVKTFILRTMMVNCRGKGWEKFLWLFFKILSQQHDKDLYREFIDRL